MPNHAAHAAVSDRWRAIAMLGAYGRVNLVAVSPFCRKIAVPQSSEATPLERELLGHAPPLSIRDHQPARVGLATSGCMAEQHTEQCVAIPSTLQGLCSVGGSQQLTLDGTADKSLKDLTY